MNIKNVEIEEFNFIVLATLNQFYDDRLFELYKLNNLFLEERVSYAQYKENLNKSNKKINVVEVKQKTDKALNSFIKSLRKEGEKNK